MATRLKSQFRRKAGGVSVSAAYGGREEISASVCERADGGALFALGRRRRMTGLKRYPPFMFFRNKGELQVLGINMSEKEARVAYEVLDEFFRQKNQRQFRQEEEERERADFEELIKKREETRSE